MELPSALAVAVAPTSICANEQLSGLRIPLTSCQPPPTANALYREFRRLVSDADIHDGLIVSLIIGAVGNPFTFSPRGKIVSIHPLRLPLTAPRPAPIFKGSDQLVLLGIHRDHGIPSSPERLDPPMDIAKLPIPIRVSGPFLGLGVEL